jgi:hypothetical protein
MRQAAPRFYFIPVLCLVAFSLAATAATGAGEVDHSPYDAFLKAYTRDGLVNYSAVKKDKSGLEAYLRTLSDSSAVHYKTWSREARMAFWINAYNAVTIYAIVTNYPIEGGGFVSKKRFPQNSIRQIKDVWDTEYMELAGRPVTLNEIEHDILRKEFADARIHFALVCASRGCPLLSDDAYIAESLDDMLEQDAVRFVNDGDKVRVNITKGRLYASEIFDWYAEDFTLEGEEIPEWLEAYKKKTRGFVSFISPRVDVQTRNAIETRGLKVTYLDYDWSLNELVDED